MKFYLIPGLLLITLLSSAQLPRINTSFKEASAKSTRNKLTVSTGVVTRTWEWTGKGLVTTGFTNLETGKEWTDIEPGFSSDWAFYGYIDEIPGKVISLTARESDDEGFTSPHLEVVAEIAYPSVESYIKYQVWVYPEAPGIRTQIWVKGKWGDDSIEKPLHYQKHQVGIEAIRGRREMPYDDKIYEMPWICSVQRDLERLEYLVSNLKKGRDYQFGLTWWDSQHGGGVQSVEVINSQNKRAFVIENTRVPYLIPLPYEKFEKHATLLAQIPGEMIDGDPLKVIIHNVEGEDAVVSEMWLYEGHMDQDISDAIIGDRYRINQLIEDAPGNYHLAAYYDCGSVAGPGFYLPAARVDYLPLDCRKMTRRYFGYNNDTQNRHNPLTHLLEEKVNRSNPGQEINKWASGVSIEEGDEGMMLIKESHKCPNQYGVGGGDFTIDQRGLVNTGTPLKPSDIDPETYSWSWASWMLAYSGGDDYRELAMKQFDRLRFPVRLERDVYTKADTWGSGTRGTDCRVMGTELEVLPELESVADLGIDGLQIDDGWQVGLSPLAGFYGWKPHPDVYPEGWKNVKRKADELGVKLALWAAGYQISLEELKWNYDEAGFYTWKLDFGLPGSYTGLNNMLQKSRKFILYTDHKAQISWDVTENDPRYGYYWAREFGCMWLSNRKPRFHYRTVTVPWIQLRENWELAKYSNTNKFQLPVKNFARHLKTVSDAWQHSESYAVALALPGTPVFFQSTRYYDEDARQEIRPLLSDYKKYRYDMFDSYVFPVGDEPTNGSWSGFQWYHPEKQTGYLLLFREIQNKEETRSIQLRFLKERELTCTNIRNDRQWKQKVNEEGETSFTIDDQAGFLLLKLDY